MLEKVREPWRASKLKSYLAYSIFGLICLTFVFVGFNPNRGGGGIGAAASVNDKAISFFELQERITMMESQLQGKIPAAQRQMYDKMIRENALEELISYELVSQSAEKIGIFPTAVATRDLIVNIPPFQDNGRFSRELYERYLTFKNTSAVEFESKIKRDVVVSQLRQLFMTALKTPKVLSQYEKQIRDTKLNVEFIKIDNAALMKSAVTAGAIDKFLATDGSKDKIQNYYNANPSEFTDKPEVRARHILIKGSDDAALSKIKEIKAESEKADFAELAKKYSQDEGSKDRGGDLNFFAKGSMVPEFENAAFSLPIGKVSDPVKTQYGYHLIKVEEHRGGAKKTLDMVSRTIAEKLLLDEVKDKKLNEIEEVLKAKKDLSPILSSLQLKWQETGEFGLNQSYLPKVDASPIVMDAVMTLKKSGEVYGKLVRSGAESYVLRLKSIKYPDTKSEAAEMSSNSLSMAGSESMGLWAEEQKKNANIQRNNVL